MALDNNRIYKRGDIVQARFDPTEGSEQSGVRPAIVLSPDAFNRHSPLLVLASLTTKNLDRIYPFEVLVEPGAIVKRRSKILLMQLRGMSQSRVVTCYGQLPPETLLEVDAALKIAVGLEKI
ncbi:mRNA interferase MazF [Abditibacterium utsteinense]|uniref:mRNA interferase n=1 Tax=Abditibacterium utsteinense TaxID=1960156 RepID=A0A2S8SQ93_9BACT|nr:type II toxin-antitoxin system PemK/MazF family toxin [Abditibacterium utsteinense]PQV62967.1 mRNA interferase MazF [Abditibacterium utsteinense]